jgi:hypothetical protein
MKAVFKTRNKNIACFTLQEPEAFSLDSRYRKIP